MSIFEFFEDMRRSNADWYTANPMEHLSDDKLAELAEELGMTVDQLKEHLTTPHPEMTCPLCGRFSTHLVGCKGCGGDAWGGEFEMAYGEEARDQLRQRFKAALSDLNTTGEVDHAVKHAYAWGGCSICAECWHHTLPAEAYQTCPIKLLADRALEPEGLPSGLFFVLMNTQGSENERQQAAREWIKSGWDRWVEHWNTFADEHQRKLVAIWRHVLLRAVWEGADSEGL